LLEPSADTPRFYSRQAIKKYIQANHDLGGTTDAAFNTRLNKAIQAGTEAGVFDRPKGKYFALIVVNFVFPILRPLGHILIQCSFLLQTYLPLFCSLFILNCLYFNKYN
jgi:hypothetical protein